MKFQTISLSVFILFQASCDQAKDVINQASTAVVKEFKDQVKSVDPLASMDASLKGWIDQTEEGVIFRKDLPFPSDVRVIIREQRELAGRVFHASEIGKNVEAIKGTESIKIHINSTPDEVQFQWVESKFTVPTLDGNKKVEKQASHPIRSNEPPTEPIVFRKEGKLWKSAKTDDFRAMVLSKELSPVFSELLVDYALAPRAQWFAKKRVKVGDELEITGSAISMLVAGNAQGTLRLKLESIDDVNGHPCGVFSVSGDYRRKAAPDFDGYFTDKEVTIESGKMWLSLLYPIILKEELHTIQTFKPSGGSPGGHGQGTIHFSVIREWRGKPLGTL